MLSAVQLLRQCDRRIRQSADWVRDRQPSVPSFAARAPAVVPLPAEPPQSTPEFFLPQVISGFIGICLVAPAAAGLVRQTCSFVSALPPAEQTAASQFPGMGIVVGMASGCAHLAAFHQNLRPHSIGGERATRVLQLHGAILGPWAYRILKDPSVGQATSTALMETGAYFMAMAHDKQIVPVYASEAVVRTFALGTLSATFCMVAAKFSMQLGPQLEFISHGLGCALAAAGGTFILLNMYGVLQHASVARPHPLGAA
jgi:hypothetical protein